MAWKVLVSALENYISRSSSPCRKLPEAPSISQLRGLVGNLRLLIAYRELLGIWTLREIRSRYRQSILGIGWAVLLPLISMVVFSFVFGEFMRVPSEGLPYPIFSYVALLPWAFFANSIQTGLPSILGNIDLLRKIYFPREILPLSAILARLVDFVISSSILILLMVWYRIPLHATVFFVPLLLLIQSMLALGISLLGAGLAVYLRDVSFVLPLAMQLWMFVTPVVYPLSSVPESWQRLYLFNPMAGIIEAYRCTILWGKMPDLAAIGIAAALSLGFCVLGYIFFKRFERVLADVL